MLLRQLLNDISNTNKIRHEQWGYCFLCNGNLCIEDYVPRLLTQISYNNFDNKAWIIDYTRIKIWFNSISVPYIQNWLG